MQELSRKALARVREEEEAQRRQRQGFQTCPNCYGGQQCPDVLCGMCNGTGRITLEKEHQVVDIKDASK